MSMTRVVSFLAALIFALPAGAVPFEEARHLLARTGFGIARATEIAALQKLDYEAAVDRVLGGVRAEPVTALPPWIDELPPTSKEMKALTAAQRTEINKTFRSRWWPLKQWWAGEMLATPSPLTEHLVVFWHNHFVSEVKKVKWAGYMYGQNALFRHHALGNFAELLRGMAKGPAMLIYLDGRTNRKGRPNENFAREVMELFTLGEGRGYSEDDIVEAARAFTGWDIDPAKGTFVFNPKRHDDGTKSFLGREGRFSGDDVIDILLEEPRVAEFITEKLWREFVSAVPEPGQVSRLAAAFRNSGYELRPLMKGLLTTPQFRATKNRGTMIKSPVDLVIGTMRVLGNPGLDPRKVASFHRQLGQDLFQPPNVKGWPGGEAWVTTNTLPLRHQFLNRVARGGTMNVAMPDSGNEGLMEVLLAVAPAVRSTATARPSKRLALLLLDPAFQLK
jgi:uncharacterized protein (DUF1800 family)